MREGVRSFVRLLADSLPILTPVYEFGAWQAQAGLSDLRPLFAGRQYVGCDIREGPGVDVIMDLHRTGLPAESVGTVLIMETLEHVRYPFRAISEVHRILKPQGIVLLSSVMNYPIHDTHDYWRFTPEALQALLEDFRSSFVEFGGDPQFPSVVVGVGTKGELAPATADKLRMTLAQWRRSWDAAEAASRRAQVSNWRRMVKWVAPPILVTAYRSCVRHR